MRSAQQLENLDGRKEFQYGRQLLSRLVDIQIDGNDLIENQEGELEHLTLEINTDRALLITQNSIKICFERKSSKNEKGPVSFGKSQHRNTPNHVVTAVEPKLSVQFHLFLLYCGPIFIFAAYIRAVVNSKCLQGPGEAKAHQDVKHITTDGVGHRHVSHSCTEAKGEIYKATERRTVGNGGYGDSVGSSARGSKSEAWRRHVSD